MTNHERSDQPTATRLERPRILQGKPLHLAGLRARFTAETVKDIPALWQRLGPHLGRIPNQVGRVAYGAGVDMFGSEEGFDYLAAVEISDIANLPADWTVLSIPAHTYAIFPHRDHVLKIKETVHAILHDWLPQSGRQLTSLRPGEPDFLERYSEDFDPQTGLGGMEVWVIVAP